MITSILIATMLAIAVPAGLDDDEKNGKTEMEDMQLIDGGTFQMGDVLDDGIQSATPIHEVTVSSFHLNKYEVTVGEFSAFVDDTGYVTSAEKANRSETTCGESPDAGKVDEYNARLASCGVWLLGGPEKVSWEEKANWRNPHFEQSSKDPVTCVSWKDAISYCNWLSRKEGLHMAYDVESGDLLDAEGRPITDVTEVKGYRLPTEAEWEFAAREGGKKIRFGNGSNLARSSEINFDADSRKFPYSEKGEFRRRTVPVGSFDPNGLGLYDMSGNVWEWCSDFLCTYTSSPQTNPYRLNELIFGPRRAARGGPWVGKASDARVAARFGWVAEDRCNNIGFRIARSK
ncbi:MAG: formylglycine-generating enzyme family protein [Planctomycetota bacterium]|jgi:formylglycine-generating enzyme required for sulfatase activity